MKQKEENYVYLVWECDQWMSKDSMVLMQVTDSYDEAVRQIMDNIVLYKSDWCDYDGDTEEEKKKALFEYIEEYLNEQGQTPQLHVNYIIQTVALNGIWEDLCY